MPLEHINADTRRQLLEAPAQRLRYLSEDRWIPYDEAKSILAELKELAHHPKVTRMPCRLVVSDSNNGKTSLIMRLATEMFEAWEDSENPCVPIIRCDAPPEPDEGRLYSAILTALEVVHRPHADIDVLKNQLVDRVAELNVRMLCMDEFHNLLLGTASKQRQLMGSLKTLLNDMRICLVACGTQEARRALAADPQFVTRFETLQLPSWKSDLRRLRRLLLSLEEWLPLPEPSNLDTRPFAEPIYRSASTIGDVVAIVRAAAARAIRNGQPCINEADVAESIKYLKERQVNP